MCISKARPKAAASQGELDSLNIGNAQYGLASDLDYARDAYTAEAGKDTTSQLRSMANADFHQATNSNNSVQNWLNSGQSTAIDPSGYGNILGEQNSNAEQMALSNSRAGTLGAINTGLAGQAGTNQSIANLGSIQNRMMLNKIQNAQNTDSALNSAYARVGGGMLAKGRGMYNRNTRDNELRAKYGDKKGVLQDLGVPEKGEGMSFSNLGSLFFRS
jgi:hypothetical protein